MFTHQFYFEDLCIIDRDNVRSYPPRGRYFVGSAVTCGSDRCRHRNKGSLI